jgi:O-antigen biosynthesis protein
MEKTYEAIDAVALVEQDLNVSYALIAEMVGTGKSVLDVGCGPGNLASVLKRRGCEVTGLDADPSALRAAGQHCVRTAQININDEAIASAVPGQCFDVVVFADVLEHVRDPAHVVASARAVMAPGGFVVASIPNVAHGAVRLALLRGRFEYQNLGILDHTHVRFFTLDSVERLFEESGYVIGGMQRTTAPVFEKSDLVPLVRREDFDMSVIDEVLADLEADTLQFVVRAYPFDDEELVLRLRGEISSREQTVRMLRAQLAQAQAASPAAVTEAIAEADYRNAAHLADGLRRQLANKEAMARAERSRLAVEITRLSVDLERARTTLATSDQARLIAELARARDDVQAVGAERDRLAAQFTQLMVGYEEASTRLAFTDAEHDRLSERLERAYGLLQVREASSRDQNDAADRMLRALERRRHAAYLSDAVALGGRAAAVLAQMEVRANATLARGAILPALSSKAIPASELVVLDSAPAPTARRRISSVLRKLFST